MASCYHTGDFLGSETFLNREKNQIAKNKMVGGQAVIEGVMMRGNQKIATAVREAATGKILVDVHEVISLREKYPILNQPILRGMVSLFESLTWGIKSLSYSAQMAGEEDEKISDGELVITVITGIFFAIVLFVIVPTFSMKFFQDFFGMNDPLVLNFFEGIVRLLVFLLYLVVISRTSEIHRVFEYHGAEHKTIHAYENQKVLTVENVQKFSRLHPRCGTSFLLIVMIVSIFVFSFLGWSSLIERIVSRIIFLPIVAGISFEFIRLAGCSQNPIVQLLSKPGLWLQHITTKPPKDDMIEVAVASLLAVLPEDERKFFDPAQTINSSQTI